MPKKVWRGKNEIFILSFFLVFSIILGQGKDYFDAMFNDLRKDTLYTKVTEKDTGHGVARVTSIDQDYINATGRYSPIIHKFFVIF